MKFGGPLKTAYKLVGSLSLLAFVFPAQGKTDNFNFQIDLNSVNFPLYIQSYASPQTVEVGDDVDVTYGFVGNQALEISNPGSSPQIVTIWPWLTHLNNPGYFTITDNHAWMLAPIISGTATTSYSSASESAAFAHLGPWAKYTIGSGSSVITKGFETTFHVDALPNGASISASEWLMVIDGTQSKVDYPSQVAVPEPSTYGMVGAIALAGLCWLRRKQK